MQFADRRHHHTNAVALPFRKVLSRKTDKVDESSKDRYTELLYKNFDIIFASLVQCLAASKVSVELNAEKIECDMYQGGKVESSAVG